jgi:hypothetical protein
MTPASLSNGLETPTILSEIELISRQLEALRRGTIPIIRSESTNISGSPARQDGKKTEPFTSLEDHANKL